MVCVYLELLQPLSCSSVTEETAEALEHTVGPSVDSDFIRGPLAHSFDFLSLMPYILSHVCVSVGLGYNQQLD